jgi:hypothetical protein
MINAQLLLRPLAVLGVAGLLAGCAGAGSPPPSSSGPMSLSHVQPFANPVDPAACKKDHGVFLTPCSLSLSGVKPTGSVKATGPKGSVFTFNAKTCESKHIATVSGSHGKYEAVWGDMSGSCSVVFTAKVKKKVIGTATLSIKNSA